MNRRKRQVKAQYAATNVNSGEHNQEHDSSPGARLRTKRLAEVPLKFLRFHAVRDRTGLSRSTIWRLERRGAFPKHRRISENAVAWLEQEINEWVLSRTAG
jgi:prophage regulatory protein